MGFLGGSHDMPQKQRYYFPLQSYM